MAGLPNAQLYFNIAFFVVMVSLIVQGGSLMKVARLAQVTLPPTPTPISRTGIEIYPTSEWEMFVYKLKDEKWCIGEPLKRLSMPEGTRITALFRQDVLLHPSGSTVLEANDILCVLGQDKDLGSLSQLFSEAPLAEEAARFFGDFFLDVSLSITAVSDWYGIELGSEEEREMTLKQLVEQELGVYPVLGDSFEWHDINWVVAEVNDYQVVKLGLCLPKTTLEKDISEA